MKKVVLVTYEGIYSLPLVEAFLKNPNYEVVRILKSGTIYGNKKGFDGVRFLLSKSSLFFIVPKFFENILFYFYKCLLPQSKRPFKTLSELSEEYTVPVEVVDDINLYPHKRLNGDILFSSYFNQIFSAETLSLYEHSFNIHPAPLPAGRGLFCQFWLLLKPYESAYFYQTIHKMTSKIDGGEVVYQKSAKSDNIDSMAGYMNAVTILGVEMMRKFDHRVVRTFHRPKCSSYFSFPKRNDVFTFWSKGCSFIKFKDIKRYLNMKDKQ